MPKNNINFEVQASIPKVLCLHNASCFFIVAWSKYCNIFGVDWHFFNANFLHLMVANFFKENSIVSNIVIYNRFLQALRHL